MNYGYNNYTNPYARNYGIPSYATQPQYVPQPQQMPQQQMAQPQPQQNIQYEMPIQYVGNGTLKEAEAYILFPNQKAIFIDKANGMVYEKICGQDGQSFISHFKRVENKAENKPVEPRNDMPTIDLSNYVERKELGAFASVKQYEELKSMLEKLQEQLNRKPITTAIKQNKEI